MSWPRRALFGALLVSLLGTVLPSSGDPTATTPAVRELPPPKKAAYFTSPVDPGTVRQTPDPPSPITQRLLELIDDAAPGANIRIAVYYLIDYRQPLYAQQIEPVVGTKDVDQGGQIVSALIRALKRNVQVRIVTEAAKESSARAIKRLQRHGARITLCDHGCAYRGGARAIMHDKFMLIDDTLWTTGREYVVAQTSANWSDKQLSTQRFNNMLVVWDDHRLYTAYRSHFRDMEAGRRGRSSGAGDAREGTAVSFFPRRVGDPVRAALFSSVLPCTPGTTISIAMGQWTASRGLGILRSLQARERQGCSVRVVVAPDVSIVKGGHMASALPAGARCTGDSRHQDIDARDVDAKDVDTDLRPSNHSKYVVINGPYRGHKEANTLFVGSANFTTSSLRQNDESWMRVEAVPGSPPENAAVVAAYSADFERIWQASVPCSAMDPNSIPG